ncbi:MAG: FAD:protein FMN transferase [Rubrimonas sp.]
MRRRPFLRALLAAAALGSLLLLGAARTAPPPREHRETLYVFGTLVEVAIFGRDPESARAATAAVGRTLQRLHADWHGWRPGALGDLNAAIAAGAPHEVDAALAALLRQSRDLACASGGLFEPAIGGLVALWGFHADAPPDGPPPAASAIEALVAAAPSMAQLRVEGRRVSATNPAIRLDLGGVAKGAALDIAAAELRAAGVDSAILNAGSTVNVVGAHGARPWRVAIRDPFEWGAVAAISLRPGEVLSTSGNYERFFEHAGARFAHILDPRTGRPVGEIVSVSVLDENGARADAATTALSVAGRARWAQTARDMGVEAVLLIADDGAIYATPAMLARLEAPPGRPRAPVRVVALPPPSDAAARCARG